jgi:hypothetical protein
MRCYLMRNGHIASVRELPGLGDQEAVDFASRLFGKSTDGFDGFEVWDRARMIIQHPPPAPVAKPAPPC